MLMLVIPLQSPLEEAGVNQRHLMLGGFEECHVMEFEEGTISLPPPPLITDVW